MAAPPLIRMRIVNYASLRREIKDFQDIHRGSFSLLLRESLEELRDYAEAITHVETGALASSHRVYYDAARQRGEISPDPSVMQHRSRRPARSVETYAAVEHARGGTHAFYQRTLNEYGEAVVRRGVTAYMGRMPGGVHQ
jgi:hypothetical protein